MEIDLGETGGELDSTGSRPHPAMVFGISCNEPLIYIEWV
jgi:hypothetical protein